MYKQLENTTQEFESFKKPTRPPTIWVNTTFVYKNNNKKKNQEETERN